MRSTMAAPDQRDQGPAAGPAEQSLDGEHGQNEHGAPKKKHHAESRQAAYLLQSSVSPRCIADSSR